MIFGVGGERWATVLPDDDSTGEALRLPDDGEVILRREKYEGRLSRLRCRFDEVDLRENFSESSSSENSESSVEVVDAEEGLGTLRGAPRTWWRRLDGGAPDEERWLGWGTVEWVLVPEGRRA
jgi:hypothetical protein